MRQKINYSHLVILTLVFGLWIDSCAKTETLSLKDEFTGKLKLEVNLALMVQEYNALPASRAVDCSQFQVQLFQTGSSEAVRYFEHVTDIPELIVLSEGEYYVTAASAGEPVTAFDSPYYFGKSETFCIIGGETCTVSVQCSMANLSLTVDYSSVVKTKFIDYQCTVGNEADSLIYVKGERRAGYFVPGPLGLRSELYFTAAGTTQEKVLTGEISQAAAGKHYSVLIDTSPDKGEYSISLSVNEQVDTVSVSLTDEGISLPVDAGNGMLLLTEIMANPNALGDTEGEWLELYNNTEEPVDLKNLVIRKAGATSFHQIAENVSITPDGYAVIGRTASACEQVDYVWSGMSLNNSGDELIIGTYGTNGLDGTVYCCIDFGEEGFNAGADGKSLQLDPSVREVETARLGSSWCLATQTYSTGDTGTPGSANTACE